MIAEITDTDIYSHENYKDYPSKAKKLRQFFEKENDENVGKVILKLLEKREQIQCMLKEADDEYIDADELKADEIKKMALEMIGEHLIFQNDEERLNCDLVAANRVLADLINVSNTIAENAYYNHSTYEDVITTEYRNLLKAKGYIEIHDQTLQGLSSNKKKAGEVDLLICENNKAIALIEGLKLSCLNKDYIDKHIEKAVKNYNDLGTPTFIISYVSVGNFADFWDKYSAYLAEYDYGCDCRSFEVIPPPSAAVRICKTLLVRDSFCFPVFFIAVKIH